MVLTMPARGTRVLMTADTMGGVWTYAMELAASLRYHGIEVVLATMGAPASEAQRRQAQRIPGLILRESRFRLEWMDAPWRDVERAGRWLLQLERQHRPDLIHLNHYSHGNLHWQAPCVVVGHSCVYSWWQAVRGACPPPDWAHYRARVRAGLRGADRVIAPSASMLQSLDQHYGPLPHTVVVRNGRTAPAVDSRPPAKHAMVLVAGRLWDAAKNIETVVRAAPGLRWPVYLAGETRHPVGGEDTALPFVHRLGRLSPDVLRHWYAAAAIYALPARYEPFGLSILEAALAGCAPVVGDIPSLRELWGSAACYVPPDDAPALRKTINRLASDDRLRHTIAQRARRRAMRYSADHMARDYLRVYAELLSRQGLGNQSAMSTSG